MPLFQNLLPTPWKLHTLTLNVGLCVGLVKATPLAELKKEVAATFSLTSTPQAQTLTLALRFPPNTFPIERAVSTLPQPSHALPTAPTSSAIATFNHTTYTRATQQGIFSTLIAGATSYLNEYLLAKNVSDNNRFYITHGTQIALQLAVAPEMLPTLTATFGAMLLDQSGLSPRHILLASCAAYAGVMVYRISLRPDLTLLTATETTLCLAGTLLGSHVGEKAFKDPLCFLREARKIANAVVTKGCKVSEHLATTLRIPRPF